MKITVRKGPERESESLIMAAKESALCMSGDKTKMAVSTEHRNCSQVLETIRGFVYNHTNTARDF